jgi:hypothetical protein
MTIDKEDLKAYVDSELSPERSAEIREAIEKDGNLAQEVAFLKLLGQGVRDVAKEPQVEGATAMLARIRRPQRTRWPIFAFGGVAALALIALVPVLRPSASDVATISGGATTQNMAVRGPFLNSNGLSPASGRDDSGGGMTGGAADGAKVSSSGRSKTSAYFMSPRKSSEGDTELSTSTQAGETTGTLKATNPQVQFAPRMVVQNGTLEEVVHDVTTAEDDVTIYTKGLGGFVESSNLTYSDEDLPIANLTLRIPAGSFTVAMNHFKSLALDRGHIHVLNVSGQDVKGQYVDASAKLKVMAAEEDSYVTMLRNARTLGQTLEIKDRLSSVREQIESLKAQADTLKNTSDLSTITLTLEQKPKPTAPKLIPPKPTSSWSSDAWKDSLDGLRAATQTLATIGIFVFVYSPIWLPLGLVGLWLYRRYR